MDNKAEQLKVFFDDIISWAEVAFGPMALVSEETKQVTWKMMEEESREYHEAATDVDRIDGAVDMFVVASQLVAMYCIDSDQLVMSILSREGGLLSDMSEEGSFDACRALVCSHFASKTIYQLEKHLDKDLSPCILNVLESNWSKYPTMDTLLDLHEDHIEFSGEAQNLFIEDAVIEQECRWIEAARDLPFGSVRGYISDYGYDDNSPSWEDGRRVYFRSEGGKGKIVKPSTYVAPNIQALI